MGRFGKPKFRGSFSGGSVRDGGRTSSSSSSASTPQSGGGGGGGGGSPAPQPPQPSPQPAAQEQPKRVIISLGRDASGRRTVENLGAGLTAQQQADASRSIISATTQARASQAQYDAAVKAQRDFDTANLREKQRTQAPPTPSFVRQFAPTAPMTSAATGRTVNVPVPVVSRVPQRGIVTYRYPGGREVTLPEGSPAPNNLPFQYPFFSGKGVGERARNTRDTLFSAVTGRGVQANVKNALGKRVLEAGASNPFATAFVLSSGYGLATTGLPATAGTGLLPRLTTLATSTVPKVATVGALTYFPAVGLVERGQKRNDASVKRGLEQFGKESVEISREAQAAERKAVREQGFLKSAAYEVPFLSLYVDGTGAYERAARRSASLMGLSGQKREDVLQASRAMRVSQGTAELAGLLTTSASTEAIGRQAIKARFAREAAKGTTFAKPGIFSKELFKIGAVEIAPLGFAEGFVQESIQQEARGRKQNLGEATLMGGFGAVTAAGLGGLIIGFAPSPKGVTPSGKVVAGSVRSRAPQKFTEFFANIADPLEKPGDLLADFGEFSTRQFRRVTGTTSRSAPPGRLEFSVPVLSDVPVVTFGSAPSNQGKGGRGGSSPGGRSPPGGGRPGTTGRFVISPNSVKPLSLPDIFVPLPTDSGGKKPVPTPVSQKVPRPGIPSVTIPDITIPGVTAPVNPIVPVPITPNVPTPVSVFVPANTPVYTPLIRFPPPLLFPPGGGFGGGGGGTGRGRRQSIYVDEVTAGRRLLNSFLQGGAFPDEGKRSGRKSSKKQRRAGRKQASNIYGFNLDVEDILRIPRRR